METQPGGVVGEVFAAIAGLLDGLGGERALLSDAERLGLVTGARALAGRLQAWAAVLAAEASEDGCAERVVGVPLVSWLAATERATRAEAHRLVAQGRALAPFPQLAAAAVAGTVSHEQAQAIAGVLAGLPADFGAEQLAEAEATMLGFAGEFDAPGLSRLGRRLVEVLDPVGADAREAARLEAELRRARAGRGLTFSPDGHGSVLIRGQLPVLAAEPLVRLVDAYADSQRRAALDRIDPLAETVTPAMRRVDGLWALVAAHQQRSLAPAHGGDRPRVVVTMNYHRLHADCARAGLLTTGDPITAGDLRRLACDAEILPVVLGGASEVLDVGRAHRLVTPPQRAALALRDGGCVFPGCDAPPARWEAHHLQPWWAGGPTKLDNLALLCPHHHGLIEPARAGPPGRRWTLHLGPDHLPEVRPPDYVDPARNPRRHQRFTLARGG